jgi:predicted acylesterase/phospholipase RssA
MKKIVFVFLILNICCSGCASFHKNPPLKRDDSPGPAAPQAETAYSFNNFLAQGNEIGDNVVVLTFSGGGTRAGALAYGVSRYLETVKLPSGKSLLDEVKVMSSVSGGSFASAYYGLYGKEKFLADYPKEVLYQNLGSKLVRNMVRVVRWVPIMFSSDVGRSELSQKVYDNNIYHDRTFKDMRRKWPFIVINATDMTQGTTFSFIQENFDRLCSDLNGVKISRAVVSSSAFPGAFTPLTFKNYPKSECGFQMPAWAQKAIQEPPENNPEAYTWAKTMTSYLDAGNRPYIHVIDGGIADNLGLMPLLYYFRTGSWDLLTPERKFKAKRLVMIVVDARPKDSDKIDRKARIPKLMNVMLSAATKPLNNYTIRTAQDFATRFTETAQAGKNFEKYKSLCERVYPGEKDREKCYDEFEKPYGGVMQPPYPEAYFIHVQFDAIPDQAFRDKVNGIRTDLQLKKSEVDSLIEAAKVILENSQEFQRLKQDLGAVVETKNF